MPDVKDESGRVTWFLIPHTPPGPLMAEIDSSGSSQSSDKFPSLENEKKSDEELGQSEVQFRMLANSIPQLCWMANADGWIFWYNQRWYEYTGTTPEQMEGWGWQSVHAPESLQQVMEQWKASLASGEPFDMIFPLKGADGVFRLFLTRVMPVKDHEGNIVRWFGTNTDISQQKEIEADLRKSKERLDLALDVAALGEWEVDLSDGKATHSVRHARIFGYDAPIDWNFDRFMEHVLPEFRAEVERTIKGAHAGGTWGLETQIRRVDGEVRWIWVKGYHRENELGKPDAMFGTVMDITERKLAEEALVSSQAKLQSIVGSAMDAVISVDEQQRIVVFNRAAERVFQCAAEEAIGSSLERFIPLKLRTAHREHMRHFGSEGVTGRSMSSPAVLTALRSNGEEFPIEATISKVQSGGEKLFTVILRDITERKLAEEALQNSQEQNELLASLIRTSSQPTGIGYPDGRLGLINRAFEQLTGYSAEELRLMDWAQVLTPPEWREMEREKLVELQRTHVPVRYEKEYVKKNGTRVPVELLVHLATDSSGNPLYYFSFITDLTERRRAEQALLRSEKLATVGRMAATIAHEINNPLAAVTNALFLAKNTAGLPESACRYLDMADAELKRIAYITRQSLGFYRESNAPALTTIHELLESAVELLKSRVMAKKAVIEKQWGGNVQIIAVAGELRQVFSNLLANSLDAIAEAGVVQLRISTGTALRGQPYVRITMADNGAGISEYVRSNLFQPFFTTKGTVGTGLGLWVSKQIVDKHGGTIRVRSCGAGTHTGTAFSVVLPMGVSDKQGQAARA